MRSAAALLLLCALSPALSFAAGAVEVTSDSTIYSGEAVKVTVANQSRKPVFLPNCSAVVFERFDGADYVALPPPPCSGEGEPIVLKPGERREFSLTPESTERQLLRPVANFALGCRSGVPLPQAECARFESSRGRYVTWAPAGEAASE